MTKLLSFYNNVGGIESKETIPLDIFLDNIESGKWQDHFFRVSALQTKKERAAAKKDFKNPVPYATISGTFSERLDEKIIEHSGYIAIDIDEDGLPPVAPNSTQTLSPDEFKSLVCVDKYVAACFISISSRGVCLLFRVNPDKHREAFAGISEYLYNHYGAIVDRSGINPSRARFVSYDPKIYVAKNKVPKFTDYPKAKEPKKYDAVIFTGDDFSEILNQIVSAQINITQNSYFVWLRIAFALANKFGEQGRQYFHTISQYSAKYDSVVCDKQFSACLRHHQEHSSNNPINISSFYYYAKEAGVKIYSDRTRNIAYAATQGKKSGLNVNDIVKNLERFEEISGDDVRGIVEQVINQRIQIEDETLIDQVEMYLRQNYSFKRNEITRYIEHNGKIIEQKDFNTIYIKLKKIFPKLGYELIDRLINSDFVYSFNPFFEWFRKHGALVDAVIPNISHDSNSVAITGIPGPVPDDYYLPEHLGGAGGVLAALGTITTIPRPGTPAFAAMYPTIVSLWDSIKCDDPGYLLYFGTKWLCGAISAIHGEHSPLYLALGGEKQGTGKTQCFRRLLPKELKRYYAESKLDAGKDDEILMCQKLIIVDDESSGKSKSDEKKVKTLTSKDIFSLREPYGRGNVDLVRLAVLGSTTNIPESILNDPTGNRRFITIKVNAVDHAAYNRVDKTELWLEAYRLYKSGFDWEVRPDEFDYLNAHSEVFQSNTSEADLILKYFEPGGQTEMTPTDIQVYLQKTTQMRLNLTQIGKELKRLGFEQRHIKIAKSTKRVWLVNMLDFGTVGTFNPDTQPAQFPASPRGGAIDGWRAPSTGSITDTNTPF